MNKNPESLEPLNPGEKEILRSLRQFGDLAPERSGEVEGAEKRWDEVTDEDLPESLRDAVALAASIAEEASTIIEPQFEIEQTPVEEELARVARLGNDISPDIEKRMEHDRGVQTESPSALVLRRNRMVGTGGRIESQKDVPPTVNLPAVRRAAIADLAFEAFTEYCTRPPADPLQVLASHGVTWSFGHYEDAFDGLLEYRNGEFHVFCNLDRDNVPDSPRARFTIAHELGHYLLDEHRNALMCGHVEPHPSKNNSVTAGLLPEREADLFAACFLMPSSLFKANFSAGSCGYDRIKRLARLFEVSLLCAAIRYVEMSTEPAAIILWNADGYAWKRVSLMLWALGCRKSVEEISAVPPDSPTGQMIRGFIDVARPEVVEGHSTIETWFPYVNRSSVRELIVREYAVSLGRFGALTLLEPIEWKREAAQSDLAGLVDAVSAWSSN